MLVLNVSIIVSRKLCGKYRLYVIYMRDRNDGGDNEDESDDVVLPLQCAHTHADTRTTLRT